MNIAIFSPSQNAYSETFIQAHKKFLKAQVFYYYGSMGRIKLEDEDNLVSNFKHWRYRVNRKLKARGFGYINEKAVLTSLKAKSVDVILVEYGTHAYNLLPILKQSALPVIVHFHGHDASVYETVKRCDNYNDVFKVASKVIVVSLRMKQMLLDLGCPKDKLLYNVYGPQPEFEKIVPDYSKKQFLSVGRFTDKKAPYYTILAFSQILEKHPDAKLLIAGEGVLLSTCRNLVRYYGLENSVQFLGIIKPDEFTNLLSHSLAYVQHSITTERGDMEGTPLSIMEASVAGLAVISTNHAGIPDVIIHGKTGLLCDEHDVASMAKNMLEVLNDKKYAQFLGMAGKRHILENFSIKRHIANLQDTLEDAYKSMKNFNLV